MPMHMHFEVQSTLHQDACTIAAVLSKPTVCALIVGTHQTMAALTQLGFGLGGGPVCARQAVQLCFGIAWPLRLHY